MKNKIQEILAIDESGAEFDENKRVIWLDQIAYDKSKFNYQDYKRSALEVLRGYRQWIS